MSKQPFDNRSYAQRRGGLNVRYCYLRHSERSEESKRDSSFAWLIQNDGEFYGALTFIVNNVILLLEKEGIQPKKQTLSNQRAQSRASAKAERQIAEVKNIL